MLEGHYCLKNREEDIEELKNTQTTILYKAMNKML